MALKLTRRVHLLVWWLTIWVGSFRFYSIQGFRLGYGFCRYWNFKVLSTSHVSVSRAKHCMNQLWSGPGGLALGDLVTMATWIRSMLCTASVSFVPLSKWIVAHRTIPVTYAATFIPGRRTGNRLLPLHFELEPEPGPGTTRPSQWSRQDRLAVWQWHSGIQQTKIWISSLVWLSRHWQGQTTRI